MNNPKIKLNDGNSIPQLGFGLWQVSEQETITSVLEALKAGYRSLDCAQIYQNESALGEAIKQSHLSQKDLFITTKIWNEEQGRDKTLKSFDVSMQKLCLSQLDMLLIHWPSPHRNLFVETWKALVELKASGRVKTIGVSNFREEDLKLVMDASGVTPAVNQVELHPHFQQTKLRMFHNQFGIKTECWSPLGQGKVLNDPTIKKIAEKHKRSPAQIIIRWHIESGFIVIPKSVTPARIRENFDVFDFHLQGDDLALLDKLDSLDGRIGPDPGMAKF